MSPTKQCLEILIRSQLGGRVIGTKEAEAGGAAKHPSVQTAPTTEHDRAPDVQLLRPKGGGCKGRGHRDSHNSQGQGEKQE